MAIAKIENGVHSRIVRIDLDTAEYVIEKIIDAISTTLNNMAYPDISEDGYEVMRYKDYTEMFEDFSKRLEVILNEIRKGNK